MKAFLNDIRRSIADFTFYREVKGSPVSRAMKYLLGILLVITVLLSIRITADIHKGLGIAADWVGKNLPVITITDGIASIDRQEPFKLEEGGYVLIIDVTGVTTNIDSYEKGILLIKDKVIYKEGPAKTETYSLAGVKSLKIDADFMKALQKSMPLILSPFILVGVYIYFIIAKLLQVLIFSLVSLLVSSITRCELSYPQIFSIGIFALTPSMVIGAAIPLIGVTVPAFGILYSGIYVIMLIMAIMNCREGSSIGPA